MSSSGWNPTACGLAEYDALDNELRCLFASSVVGLSGVVQRYELRCVVDALTCDVEVVAESHVHVLDGVPFCLFYGRLCGLQEFHPECVFWWKHFVKCFADFVLPLRCEVGAV